MNSTVPSSHEISKINLLNPHFIPVTAAHIFCSTNVFPIDGQPVKYGAASMFYSVVQILRFVLTGYR